MRLRRVAGILLQAWGALSLALLMAGALLLLTAGYWLRTEDEPRPADAIVVLGGEVSRAVHAADLYLTGLAPVIYLCRPAYEAPEPTCSLGVHCSRQEDDMLLVLAAKGVPREAVRVYGQDILSTVEEGEALRRELAPEQKTLLVVTSAWHSRRTKLIFSRLLGGRELIMATSPYERFERRWWTHQGSARHTLIETAKFAFYFLGKPFRSNPQQAGQTQGQ